MRHPTAGLRLSTYISTLTKAQYTCIMSDQGCEIMGRTIRGVDKPLWIGVPLYWKATNNQH